jgi:hypothetical protein
MKRLKTLTYLVMTGVLLWAAATPASAATKADVKKLVIREARETVVPPSLALAVVKVESGFADDLESPEGARGVMQLTPEMARAHGLEPDALWRARENIRLGLKLLGEHFKKADQKWRVALARFAKSKPGGLAPKKFARQVLRLERRFAEAIIAKNAVEQRKRVVLKVARDGRAYFEDEIEPQIEPGRREPKIAWAKPSRRPVFSVAGLDDFDGTIEARRRAARPTLDDFSAGRIPDYLARGSAHRERR